MAYELAIDVDALVAIDTHVHIEIDDDGINSLPQTLTDAASKYFKADHERPSLDAIADLYRERKMAAVVFTVEAATALKHVGISSEFIAAGAARNNDVLIPFGSVDPLTGAAAITRARMLVADHGVRGFKFHPTVQNFDPSLPEFWPLWAALEERGFPAIFHTGQTGIGSGLAGGFGMRLRLSNPMLLDDVAAAFPALQIVLAHPSVPWQEEGLAVATHKANVWMDLSGWSPKYFAPALIRQANSILQDKVMFGSDFPLLTPDRWLRDFADLDIKEDVRPKILKDNAVRLLGLEVPSAGPSR
jgi:predicted TIM-barrel fold metal-dependent hydrolase